MKHLAFSEAERSAMAIHSKDLLVRNRETLGGSTKVQTHLKLRDYYIKMMMTTMMIMRTIKTKDSTYRTIIACQLTWTVIFQP